MSRRGNKTPKIGARGDNTTAIGDYKRLKRMLNALIRAGQVTFHALHVAEHVATGTAGFLAGGFLVPIVKELLTDDHIKPKKFGGSKKDPQNRQLLFHSINQEKGHQHPWDPDDHGYAAWGKIVITGSSGPYVIQLWNNPYFWEELPEHLEQVESALARIGHIGTSIDAPFDYIPSFIDDHLTQMLHLDAVTHVPELVEGGILGRFGACGDWLVRDVPNGISHICSDMLSAFGHAAGSMLDGVQPVIEAVAPAAEFCLNILEHTLL